MNITKNLVIIILVIFFGTFVNCKPDPRPLPRPKPCFDWLWPLFTLPTKPTKPHTIRAPRVQPSTIIYNPVIPRPVSSTQQHTQPIIRTAVISPPTRSSPAIQPQPVISRPYPAVVQAPQRNPRLSPVQVRPLVPRQTPVVGPTQSVAQKPIARQPVIPPQPSPVQALPPAQAPPPVQAPPPIQQPAVAPPRVQQPAVAPPRVQQPAVAPPPVQQPQNQLGG